MTAATRAPAGPAKKPTPPPGQGELHDSLIAANELARLARIAESTGCSTQELATESGKGIDLPRLFDAMRRRGYTVDDPKRPTQQLYLSRGLEVWTVDISICGTRATMAFYVPAPQKKSTN